MTPGTKRKWVWGGLAAVTFFVWALLWGPWLLEGRHVRDDDGDLVSSAGIIITGLRTALIAIAAGAIAGLGLWYTHKNHELSREEQVTDRYVEAIKLLGSENLHERLGGIYSLERIMKDSEKDQATIIEVLAAFIRTPAPGQREHGAPTESRSRADGNAQFDDPPDPPSRDNPAIPLSVDVQAALTVLGRRPDLDGTPMADLRRIDWHNTDLEHANLQRVDLTGADLRGAQLRGADLTGADLTGAQLKKADFKDARLHGVDLRSMELRWADLRGVDLAGVDGRDMRPTRVDLSGAQLTGADFRRADLRSVYLRGADFTRAQLMQADLTSVDLSDAVFTTADLRGARLHAAHLVHVDLRGADLRAAEGLTVQQLLHAQIYDDTKLPKDIKADRRIKDHIRTCEAMARWREEVETPKKRGRTTADQPRR